MQIIGPFLFHSFPLLNLTLHPDPSCSCTPLQREESTQEQLLFSPTQQFFLLALDQEQDNCLFYFLPLPHFLAAIEEVLNFTNSEVQHSEGF